MFNFKIRTLSLALFILCISALPAGAQFLGPSGIFGFVRITSNNIENIADQLSVSVFDIGGDQVNFTFFNNVGIASSVSEIYFDDGTLLGLSKVANDPISFLGDPDFTEFTTNGSANPGNLPGGENLLLPFEATAGFSADAQGNPAKGLNRANEVLQMIFDLQAGKTVADVIADLNSGALRIGLHVSLGLSVRQAIAIRS